MYQCFWCINMCLYVYIRLFIGLCCVLVYLYDVWWIKLLSKINGSFVVDHSIILYVFSFFYCLYTIFYNNRYTIGPFHSTGFLDLRFKDKPEIIVGFFQFNLIYLYTINFLYIESCCGIWMQHIFFTDLFKKALVSFVFSSLCIISKLFFMHKEILYWQIGWSFNINLFLQIVLFFNYNDLFFASFSPYSFIKKTSEKINIYHILRLTCDFLFI
jgi:hypothetical protein